MDTKTQLQEAKDKLAQLDPNNRDNLVEMARLNTLIGTLTAQLAQEDAQQIEQAHEQRVASTVDAFDALMDEIELKKYVGEGPDYQSLKIRLKRAFHAQADELSRQLKDANLAFSEKERSAQAREDALQEKLIQEQNNHLQTTMELQDMTSKRDAAAAELEEAKKKIANLESWNQDLREQAAFGVSGSLTIIDDEELKRQEAELEKQRLKERTIYDLQWEDEIKRKRYIAKRAIDDQPVDFPYFDKAKYNIIEASEVLQFRSEYEPAEPQLSAEVSDVDTQSVQAGLEQEASFPPSIEPPDYPALSVDLGTDQAAAPGTGEAGADVQQAQVSRAEHEELKQRVAALELAVKRQVA